MRTPGQLLSLTSHLSFGSGGESTQLTNMSSETCENLIDDLRETSMIIVLNLLFTKLHIIITISLNIRHNNISFVTIHG